MRPRYVLALVKHETNTFSPIATPLASFGHGEGPAFGPEVVGRYRNTATPLAAYIDYRLATSGRQGEPLFTEAALDLISKDSSGRALRINLLADLSLQAAAA